MKKYRISKYNPKYRNKKGEFLLDTWTSYSDIGKKYNGNILTLNEYLSVENKYINIILFILKQKKINKVKIEELEINFSISELERLLKDEGLSLIKKEKLIFNSISNGNVYNMEVLPYIIRLILRDCLWCKLIDLNLKCYIEFGYDLYVYINCDHIGKILIEYVNKLEMYVEELNFI